MFMAAGRALSQSLRNVIVYGNEKYRGIALNESINALSHCPAMSHPNATLPA
jgi:hypothetical protein